MWLKLGPGPAKQAPGRQNGFNPTQEKYRKLALNTPEVLKTCEYFFLQKNPFETPGVSLNRVDKYLFNETPGV